jgi:hypothetical protein
MTARYAHLSDRMMREATDKASRLLAAPTAAANVIPMKGTKTAS